MEFTKDEKELLEWYRSANAYGKDAVLENFKIGSCYENHSIATSPTIENSSQCEVDILKK